MPTMSKTYDIVTVGGGLAGSALAKTMAERGARVLILEPETQFWDRVRGEFMVPWGVAEAKELGVHDTIMRAGAHALPWWNRYEGATIAMHRPLPDTTAPGQPGIAFYHPKMQETLLNAARDAGAEVKRGARVRDVTKNGRLQVIANADDGESTFEARLVVGADGKNSLLRAKTGFSVRRETDHNIIAGVLMDGVDLPEDTAHEWPAPPIGQTSLIFPQGNGRARVYVVYGSQSGERLSGEKDLGRFLELVHACGVPPESLRKACPAGPLASYSGTFNGVDHPYRDGVVLIGDSATETDPSWGQGLSTTLRDVRVLRDNLIESDDWGDACEAYAREHDRYASVLRTIQEWMTAMLLDTGPKADERRNRALPLWAEDPTRPTDVLFSGPDITLDDSVRRRFFAEDGN
jgi:2-polyprenyl-6-methoxyphenol hydroxylase-like FAD-dependent oxidoreductase